MLLWFIFVAILGYFVQNLIKSRISSFTSTPGWIFWWILMTPALVLTAWLIVMGPNNPPPSKMVFLLFLFSFFFSFWFISIGQKRTKTPSEIVKPELIAPAVKVVPIEPDEEARLRDCFPWSIYYLQQLDYKPQAILCRGRLRTNSDEAYLTIKSNIERAFGQRFLVLFQDSLKGPFFALVPNTTQEKTYKDEPVTRPFFALLLLLITLFTTTYIGTRISGGEIKNLEANISILRLGLPYSLGLMVILGTHELGHYFAAVKYKIKTTLPYFIPLPFFLGTFGAFIQMKSSVPNRRALFDVSIAGPITGFLVTIPLLLWGLSLSSTVNLDTGTSNILNFHALDPRFSLLLSLLSKIALGSTLSTGKAIVMHPLAIAGYIGLIVTALNLLPVGQLDGGHIVHAMYGQRTAVVVGQITRILVFLLALGRPDLILWAILLFLFPLGDQPALNDVSELNNGRDFLGLSTLALLLTILLPVPNLVSQWLSI
jgi:membrane-associated protease RseP (regulator of RpoE activity)